MKENRLFLFCGITLLLGIFIGFLAAKIMPPPSASTPAPQTTANHAPTHLRTSVLSGDSLPSGDQDAFRSSEAAVDSTGIESLALSLVDKESDEILAALEKIQGAGARERFLRTVFGKIALEEPQFAMELARVLPDSKEQMTALKSIALELAFSPQNMAGDDPQGLEAAMLGATVALASTNPEAATLWASTQLEGRARGMAIMASASRWAANDPTAALAWAAENQGEGGEGAGWMMNRMLSSASETDPATSAAYLASLPEGRTRSGAVGSVARNWFDKNPQQALDWMKGLSSEDQRQAANSIASRWVETQGAQEALQWANTLTDEAARTAAITSSVGAWARTDAPTAANYAKSLPDNLRAGAVRSAVRSWNQQDSAAATAWIQQIEDESLQKAALDAIQRGGRGGGRGGSRFSR